MWHLAPLYLELPEELLHFCTEYIDEESNKLFLVNTVYLDNLWFDQNCSIYKTFMIDVIIRMTKHSKPAYFNKDVSKETKGLMLKVPVINRDWESKYAALD